MQLRTKWLSITSLGLAAVVVSGTAAVADPYDVNNETYTLNRALNGTGSDTTQDLNNGLAMAISDGDELLIGSWDATTTGGLPNSFVTHTGGTTIPRPNGSGQGVAALKASVSGSVLTNARGTSSGPLDRTDLQFARSSSGVAPSTTGLYSYVPLAVDAVSYAVNPLGTLQQDMSLAELKAVYSASNGTPVTINGVSHIVGDPSYAAATIHPYLPQSGSGTRSFFLGQLGLTEVTKGSAVRDVYTGGSVQEHDGAVVEADRKGIVPFSVAQFIAQGNSEGLEDVYQVQVADRRHNAVIGKVDHVDPVNEDGVLETDFPITRPVFTVVEHAAIASNADLAYAFIDDPSTTAIEGAVYLAQSPAVAGALVIEDFGFGSLIKRNAQGQLENGVEIGGELYAAGDAENYRTN